MMEEMVPAGTSVLRWLWGWRRCWRLCWWLSWGRCDGAGVMERMRLVVAVLAV